MISIALTTDQTRKVTVDHIAHTLIIQKQYLNDTQIAKYKYMLGQFASLRELDEIAEKFNRAWPTDLLWNSI